MVPFSFCCVLVMSLARYQGYAVNATLFNVLSLLLYFYFGYCVFVALVFYVSNLVQSEQKGWGFALRLIPAHVLMVIVNFISGLAVV